MKIIEGNAAYYEKNTRDFVFSWLLLLLGLLLTGLVGYQIKTDIELNERQNFELRCKEIQVKIQTRLAVHKQMLLSGAGMFDSSKEVSRAEWHTYVKRLSLNRNLDGVQALGFALWVKPDQLKAHEDSLHKEGFTDYHVKPEGKRDAYSAIIYIEPFADRNLRAFGYDMYSEPIRRAAMRQAIDSDDVSLSGKVILLQEDTKDVQGGALMYAPVYQKNKPIETIEQRREAIFGWVYSPFRMTDLLRNIVLSDGSINVSDLRLQVYDGEQVRIENLLYQSEESISKTPPIFSLETQMEFLGTTWTLQFEKFASTVKRVDYSKVWFILGAGTLLNLLLFFLLRSYFMMRVHAHEIALKLTQQLRESEQRFRLLADSAPVMIWSAGTDKVYDYFNKVWLDFSGRTLAELQGNGWASDVHVDDLQRCLTAYDHAFAARQAFKTEYRLKRHDGEYRWILNTAVPRFSGEIFTGYIGSCLDITDRYQIELDLKVSERKLAISNADLLQFTNIAAHHLQEPIRRVISFVQRLQNELAGCTDSNEEAEFALKFIEQSAFRQRALVRDIQLYLAATLSRAVTESVDVGDIIRKVLERNSLLIRKTNARIEYGELPAVMIDRPRLHDIFNILLDNTLRYRQPDCILQIRIYGKNVGTRVHYYVEDNGIGIPAEYRERVFLVFERLQVNENQDSTGIGLAIVRRIVESCDGTVILRETVGGGATVVFDLPAGI